MLQVHKKSPMDQYPADIFALRSILQELGKRGHRLRHPEIKAEYKTASTENLGREPVNAESETEVRIESEPTSK